ncbi:coiled-coil domain-containing protein, partial [Bacillus cereus]|uniref:coiled-coil domain-containing protein n=1 Tax=Bacillus cereus TaxID=1396 RepID=UPI00345BE4C8
GQIVNQDKEIIETQTKEKNLVEDKKVKVSENLVAIEKDLKSLQSLNNELDAQKEEKNKFVASLTEEQKKVQKEID